MVDLRARGSRGSGMSTRAEMPAARRGLRAGLDDPEVAVAGHEPVGSGLEVGGEAALALRSDTDRRQGARRPAPAARGRAPERPARRRVRQSACPAPARSRRIGSRFVAGVKLRSTSSQPLTAGTSRPFSVHRRPVSARRSMAIGWRAGPARHPDRGAPPGGVAVDHVGHQARAGGVNEHRAAIEAPAGAKRLQPRRVVAGRHQPAPGEDGGPGAAHRPRPRHSSVTRGASGACSSSDCR